MRIISFFIMNFENIIEKIIKTTGVEEKIILSKIDDKMQELDNLISKQGAAHIIANELKVDLVENKVNLNNEVKLKDLVSGLRNVIVSGKVVDVYQINSYNKNGKELRVGALSISDGTGFARVVFWEDNIEIFKKIKQGDILRIINAYVKENKFGKLELHISFRTKVRINPNDINKDNFKDISYLAKKSERLDLIEIERDMQVRIFGMVVQLFKKNCFFNVCPECQKSVKIEDGVYICKEHGKVLPIKKIFISFTIDDGTSNIRCTSFGRNAEMLLGIKTEEAIKLSDEHEDNKYPIEHCYDKVIGKEIIIYGKSNFNTFTNDIEIITNKIISPIDFINEINLIKKEIKYGDND